MCDGLSKKLVHIPNVSFHLSDTTQGYTHVYGIY